MNCTTCGGSGKARIVLDGVELHAIATPCVCIGHTANDFAPPRPTTAELRGLLLAKLREADRWVLELRLREGLDGYRVRCALEAMQVDGIVREVDGCAWVLTAKGAAL